MWGARGNDNMWGACGNVNMGIVTESQSDMNEVMTIILI